MKKRALISVFDKTGVVDFAKFLVERMIVNKKNDVKINWLTNAKASFRFMTSGFNKRDFFLKS